MDEHKQNHHNPSMISNKPPTYFSHNGFSSSDPFSDTEMVKKQSVSYTSLRDLLPPVSSPTMESPTKTVHSPCWQEIPIKNPLVKHAALAYLQPMRSPPAAGEEGLLWKLKERCCGECGCVLWILDVVLRKTKEAFWKQTGEVVGDVDDDDDEDEVD